MTIMRFIRMTPRFFLQDKHATRDLPRRNQINSSTPPRRSTKRIQRLHFRYFRLNQYNSITIMTSKRPTIKRVFYGDNTINLTPMRLTRSPKISNRLASKMAIMRIRSNFRLLQTNSTRPNLSQSKTFNLQRSFIRGSFRLQRITRRPNALTLNNSDTKKATRIRISFNMTRLPRLTSRPNNRDTIFNRRLKSSQYTKIHYQIRLYRLLFSGRPILKQKSRKNVVTNEHTKHPRPTLIHLAPSSINRTLRKNNMMIRVSSPLSI